ncbi:MAG: ZIP family metal transporter [Myxococcales bacterium]
MLGWIVGFGLLMSAIALVGSITLVLPEKTLKRLVLPLVAMAAGSLIGGALFHMLPAGVDALGNGLPVYLWTVAGFALFFVLEQFLHWHHCHRVVHTEHRPLGYLVLLSDGLHNLLGGMAVAGAFLTDLRLGIATWIAAALHEVPQELGDFGVLVHSGWSPGRALLYNLLSGLTFVVGGVLAWAAAAQMDVSFLLPFAAGNFLYIGAADLVPEVAREQSTGKAALHFAAFVGGLALLLLPRLLLGGHG